MFLPKALHLFGGYLVCGSKRKGPSPFLTLPDLHLGPWLHQMLLAFKFRNKMLVFSFGMLTYYMHPVCVNLNILTDNLRCHFSFLLILIRELSFHFQTYFTLNMILFWLILTNTNNAHCILLSVLSLPKRDYWFLLTK